MLVVISRSVVGNALVSTAARSRVDRCALVDVTAADSCVVTSSSITCVVCADTSDVNDVTATLRASAVDDESVVVMTSDSDVRTVVGCSVVRMSINIRQRKLVKMIIKLDRKFRAKHVGTMIRYNSVVMVFTYRTGR